MTLFEACADGGDTHAARPLSWSISDDTGVILAIDPGTKEHGWVLLVLRDDRRWRPTLWGHSPSAVIASKLRDHDSYPGLRVAIEAPAGYAYSAAVVPGLLETRGAAGELAGCAREHRRQVVQVRAEVWRRLLTGEEAATDRAIETMLGWVAASRGGIISELPRCSASERPHVLDALGLGAMLAREGEAKLEALEAELQKRDRERRSAQRELPGSRAKTRGRGAVKR